MQDDCPRGCPVLNELLSLREYKEKAESRIVKLEEELASHKCESPKMISKYHFKEEDYARSLKQLSAVEADFQRLTAENRKLRSKLKHSQKELDEWRAFGHTTFSKITETINETCDSPGDDGKLARFVLDDLLQKMCDRYREGSTETPKYAELASKYESTKTKLRDIRRKCDRMLAIIADHGIQFNDEEPTKPCKCVLEDRMKAKAAFRKLNADMKSLTALTRQMKGGYKAWQCCKTADVN